MEDALVLVYTCTRREKSRSVRIIKEKCLGCNSCVHSVFSVSFISSCEVESGLPGWAGRRNFGSFWLFFSGGM